MSKPFYLTTAIYYANAAPHIGHAYEIIGADVIARFHRLMGDEVFFLTGTDEHGVKVQKTAAKHEQTPQAYVDSVAEQFKICWRETLNVDYNRFIRTTDADHKSLVQSVWRDLVAKGDIYKAAYTGQYCSGCETFLTERDLTDNGLCPNHLTPPEPVQEENYFFRLSHYKDTIRQHITENPEWIIPSFRRTEILNQLDDLEDISVSRAKDSVSWGIPVPDDPDQVIYVWIDALSNYLTGADMVSDKTHFQALWPPDVQVIGKDILRFHAIYWPAMLMAAKLPLPKHLLVHGFITVSETKISKSLGNVISPVDLMERFELKHSDPIRYFMMATTGFGQDGSYTDEEFKLRINADLANNLGNLLNRTLNMLKKYHEGVIPAPSPDYSPLLEATLLDDIQANYLAYKFNDAIGGIMQLVDAANKTINDREPWTLAKEGKLAELADVMVQVLEALRQAAILLSPITPVMSQQLWAQLGFTDCVSDQRWGDILDRSIPTGQTTALGEPLLLRLDSEIVGAGKKK